MKIATRKSLLATFQAQMAKNFFEEHGVSCEFLFLETSGDKSVQPLFAGKGIFTKELQKHLLDGKADIAVHSLKDLPIECAPPLAICALLPRASREDVLIVSPKVLAESSLDQLSADTCAQLSFQHLKVLLLKSAFFRERSIGTSSLRRQTLVKRYLGQELNCLPLRGNVNSRLDRVRNNEYSCIILAKAGLERLNLYSQQDMFLLDPEVFVPSAGQGVIAIESCFLKEDKSPLIDICRKISSVDACIEAGFERLVLRILGSDCYTPVGVYFNKTALFVITEARGDFLSCQIEIPQKELHDAHELLKKHQNLYSPFFDDLFHSDIAKRMTHFLTEKKFI